MLNSCQTWECPYYDDLYGCLCSSYDIEEKCPTLYHNRERNKFEDEYAKWVLEEKRFEEE